MKIKCFSVRLKSLDSISVRAYKATSFDGSKAILPKSQVFECDNDVSKSEAYWISEWILEKKDLQYSRKKEAWFDSNSGQMVPTYKDGVTMPVVVANQDKKKKPFVVVDGFHRTTVISQDKEISESIAGYVPTSRLNKSIEDRITATVRHNMARGTHQVELSAKLVAMLKKHNWTNG